jgi:hypothetical protein
MAWLNILLFRIKVFIVKGSKTSSDRQLEVFLLSSSY